MGAENRPAADPLMVLSSPSPSARRIHREVDPVKLRRYGQKVMV